MVREIETCISSNLKRGRERPNMTWKEGVEHDVKEVRRKEWNMM